MCIFLEKLHFFQSLDWATCANIFINARFFALPFSQYHNSGCEVNMASKEIDDFFNPDICTNCSECNGTKLISTCQKLGEFKQFLDDYLDFQNPGYSNKTIVHQIFSKVK